MRLANIPYLLLLLAALSAASTVPAGNGSVSTIRDDNTTISMAVFQGIVLNSDPWPAHHIVPASLVDDLLKSKQSAELIRYTIKEWDKVPYDIQNLVIEAFLKKKVSASAQYDKDIVQKIIGLVSNNASWLTLAFENQNILWNINWKSVPMIVFEEAFSQKKFTPSRTDFSFNILCIWAKFSAEQSSYLRDKIAREVDLESLLRNMNSWRVPPMHIWMSFSWAQLEEAILKLKSADANYRPDKDTCRYLLKKFPRLVSISILEDCLIDVAKLNPYVTTWYDFPGFFWDHVKFDDDQTEGQKQSYVRDFSLTRLESMSMDCMRGFLDFAGTHNLLSFVFENPMLVAVIINKGVQLNGPEEIAPYFQPQMLDEVMEIIVQNNWAVSEFLDNNYEILPDVLLKALRKHIVTIWSQKHIGKLDLVANK